MNNTCVKNKLVLRVLFEAQCFHANSKKKFKSENWLVIAVNLKLFIIFTVG